MPRPIPSVISTPMMARTNLVSDRQTWAMPARMPSGLMAAVAGLHSPSLVGASADDVHEMQQGVVCVAAATAVNPVRESPVQLAPHPGGSQPTDQFGRWVPECFDTW